LSIFFNFKAIYVLLDDPQASTKLKQEADIFLIEFQKLPDAWELSAKFLSDFQSVLKN
jgi:hypothetical protein